MDQKQDISQSITLPAETLKLIASYAVKEQSSPISNELRPCFAIAMDWLKDRPELLEAIGARSELGLNQYGAYLQPDNGRCPSIDGFQESLDNLNYLIQEWIEAMVSDSPFVTDIAYDFYNQANIATRQLNRIFYKNGKNSR